MTGQRVPKRRLLTACGLAALLVLAACGKASDGGKTADPAEAGRAFAQCMRASGVPDYPDPDPSGRPGAGHDTFNRDDPTFKAANEKCRDLLPGGGEHDVQGPEAIQGLLKFAQCMRDNGVPDFPDPDADGKFPEAAERGAHADPKFQAASEKCRKDLPQHGGG
ncbi:hypothetical protein BH20ACT24_BH20ACT24_04060 [soil metagenome]